MKKPVDIRKVETKGEVGDNIDRPSPIDTSPRFQHFITFADTLLAPGQNTMICAQSIVTPFKPRRLVISPSCAKDVIVYELKVGNMSFMFNNHGVCGDCFPPLPEGADLETMLRLESLLVMEMDSMQRGQIVGIGIQNATEKRVRFTGMLWGVTR